jgi:ABC-2 type transport system ATP-binding protein
MPPIAIETTKVTVRLGGARVLDKVSLEVHPGEILCILGPNGAGKTTLLQLLAGCLFKTRNRIRIFGLNRWRCNREIRTLSTFVPADFRSLAGTCPHEYLAAIATFYGLPPERYATRLAAMCYDLNYEQYLRIPWGHLSLGLRQKALLIGGFLPDTPLRILDEPMATGIDPMGLEIVGVWMREARERGETIVFSTQILDKAHLLADRIMILHKGRMVMIGPPRELIEAMGLSADDPFALNQAFFRFFQENA